MMTRSHNPGAKARFLYALMAASVAVATASPAFAAEPEPQAPQAMSSQLTGAVYDGHGMPLIGAMIWVALPGSSEPESLTISDTGGRFSVGLNPGVYTLMARSFGHVEAVVPQVSVPRAEPIRLQLRSQREVTSMLSDSAPLDIGYALRPRVRDILRQTEPGGTAGGDSPWLASVSERSMWTNVGGELSLWTLAPVEGNFEDSHSATDLSMGSVAAGKQNWVMRGQLADGGVVRARSELTRRMSDDHAMRVAAGFASKDLATDPDSELAPTSMWVGSVSVDDVWRIGETFQVGGGLRFEHYNYLEETALMSPRVQVAYALVDSITVMTGVSYNAEAPGLAELRFQVDPLSIRYMDVLAVENIDPERTTRYEVGVQTVDDRTTLQARAYHDEIRDELVGIYLANGNGTSDYRVANLGDSVTQGIQVDFQRSFLGVSALASYGYAWREGSDLPVGVAAELGLLSSAPGTEVAEVDEIHEVAAGVETVVGLFDTRLHAMYRWQTGVPVVRDGNVETVYERLDVNVRQPLPFRAFSSDWSALLQVQNVLGTDYDGVFDFRLGRAPVLTRLFSGGLAVRF